MPLASYSFGEFQLDSARFELSRDGQPVKLERIPMELLILLAESGGNVVSRQEIAERLWGKDVHVDTEHSINTAVRKIRQALRDDPEKPRYVLTVTGKGYRFVAEQKNEPPAQEGAPLPPISLPVETFNEPAPPLRRQGALRPAVIAAVSLFLLAALLFTFNVGSIRSRWWPASSGQIHSIAVLPLANLSGDPSQDYFADGMTDELITMLAKNTPLRVVSRTSAMQYKAARRPVREIAQELGVDAILEGSVEKSGNRVHMTVQLIRAASDAHLWAESYDRDFNSAFSLPSELSETIARQVNSAVTPPKPEKQISAAAHDAYLRGRYLWFAENYSRSKQDFETAIRLQPDYAAAWSGIADCYTATAVVQSVPSKDVMPRAREAALKALHFDDSVPEVHNAVAAVYLFGDWDLKRAEQESQRAISLPTGYAEAHHLRSFILASETRFDDAIQEEKHAIEMDPFARPWALGVALIQARRFEEAAGELRLRADAQPLNPITFLILADAYFHLGKAREYAESMASALELWNDKASASAVRRAFASGGIKAVAEWDFSNTKLRSQKEYVGPLALAESSAHLGDKDQTLHYLEVAYREHEAALIFLQASPAFDFLHGDQRYRALVTKMGMTPSF